MSGMGSVAFPLPKRHLTIKSKSLSANPERVRLSDGKAGESICISAYILILCM